MSKYEKGLISINVDTVAEFAEVFKILPMELLAVPYEGKGNVTREGVLNREYMYAYDGKRRRVMRSILEQFHTSEAGLSAVQLFYDMDELKIPGKCSVVYSGVSKRTELWQCCNLQSETHAMDQIWICSMDGLSRSNYKVGILAGLSSATMYPCARKVIISSRILNENDIMEELVFSREDIRLLRKNNLFTVSQFILPDEGRA